MTLTIIIAVLILILLYSMISRFFTTDVREALPCNPPKDKVAKVITFQGGGFKSVSCFTGALTGILKAANRESETELNTFLNEFDIVGANSGGCWFVNLVTHSKRYYDMIDESARTYRKLFGECSNIDPTDFRIIPLCTGEGETSCRYGEGISRCCCGIGYKPYDNICIKCEDVNYFTFDDYITGVINSSSSLFNEIVKNDINSISGPLGVNVASLLDTILDVNAYSVYVLASGKYNWSDFVPRLIFDPVGDVPDEMLMSSNPNGLKSIQTFAGTVANTGIIKGKYNNISYTLGESQAFSTPFRLAYNPNPLSEFDSLITPRDGISRKITYESDAGTISLSYPNPGYLSDYRVRDICTWSGSASTAAMNERFYKGLVDDISPIITDTLYNLCDIPKCDPYESLALYLNGLGAVLYSDDDSDRYIVDHTPLDLPFDTQTLLDKSPVFTADGFFGGDNTGIISAISEAQKLYPPGTRIKIISLCHSFSFAELSSSIAGLFGATQTCEPTTYTETSEYVDFQFVPGFNTKTTNGIILASNKCNDYRCIFNARYDDPVLWFNTLNCSSDSSCSASVNINAWQGVETLENNAAGIAGGYTVDLFCMYTILSSKDDRKTPIPGDLGDATKSDFTLPLSKQTQLIEFICSNIPQDVYDVVFGDTKYCPVDFPDVRDKVRNLKK